jgi:hypothetical protein
MKRNMNLKMEHAFELLTGDAIELCLDIEIDDEGTVILPADLAGIVARYAADHLVPKMIKEIENLATDLEQDGTANEWLNEDARDYAEAYGDAMYEEMKDRKMGL